MATRQELQRKFAQVWPHLDERARRLVAATEAGQLGYGGIARVSAACGLSRVNIGAFPSGHPLRFHRRIPFNLPIQPSRDLAEPS